MRTAVTAVTVLRTAVRLAGLAFLVELVLVAAPARADKPDDGAHPAFWDGVARPHAAEVDKLIEEGVALRDRANQFYEAQQEPPRHRLLFEAEKRFLRAVELDPHHAGALRSLALVASDLGDFGRVVAATELIHGAGMLAGDRLLATTLATAYIKLGRWDDAIELLEHLVGGETSSSDRGALFGLLGYAYMGAGRLEDSIATYDRAVHEQPVGGDIQSLNGLAVAYDRDEQVARAAEVLGQLHQLDPDFSSLMHPASSTGAGSAAIPFSPPGDRHYWFALAYQAQDRLAEASAAWRAYLASPAPRFRHRAEEHLREVDAALAAKRGKHP